MNAAARYLTSRDLAAQGITIAPAETPRPERPSSDIPKAFGERALRLDCFLPEQAHHWLTSRSAETGESVDAIVAAALKAFLQPSKFIGMAVSMDTFLLLRDAARCRQQPVDDMLREFGEDYAERDKSDA